MGWGQDEDADETVAGCRDRRCLDWAVALDDDEEDRACDLPRWTAGRWKNQLLRGRD